MQVSSSSKNTDVQADSTDKAEKRRGRAAKKNKTEEKALEKAATDKASTTAKANKTDSAGRAQAVANPDRPAAEVLLSPKAKAASISEREMKEAETLMDHVDSGKLSKDEHDLAMGRVGEILKRYGKA